MEIPMFDLSRRPRRHSYSSMKLFKQCRAAYGYAYLQKLPTGSTAAMDRGTRLHKLAEDYMNTRDMPCPYDIKKIGLKIYNLREKGAVPEQTWLLDADWNPVEQADEHRAKIKAIVDVHIPPKDNVLKLHDYKSGRPYPDHDDQLEFYALVGLRRFPDAKRAEASAIYIDSGNESQPRSILREMFPHYAKRWITLIGQLDDEVRFMPSPGGHCTRCDFRSDKGGPCDAWRTAP